MKTGLNEYEVGTLSAMTDWKGVDIYTLRTFTEACGVDLTDPRSMKRVTVYLRGKTVKGIRMPVRFDYLRRSPEWTTLFQPLMRRWFNQMVDQSKEQ